MNITHSNGQAWISNALMMCGFSALAIATPVPARAQETIPAMAPSIPAPVLAPPVAEETREKSKKASKNSNLRTIYAPSPSTYRPPLLPFAPKREILKVIPNEAGDLLYVTGRISAGSFITFKQVLAANPKVKTIVLNSPGGAILDGALIGYWINRNGLNTHVDLMCASSCTQIFAGGKVRTLAPASQLGFHQPYLRPTLFSSLLNSESGSGKELSVAMMRQSYARAGIKGPFMDRVLKVHWTTMWFPTATELSTFGFTSSTPAPVSIIVPKTVAAAQSKIETALAADAFWPALKQADQGLYTQSVSHAVMEALTKTDQKAVNFNAIAGNYVAERLIGKFDGLSDELLLAFGPTFEKRLGSPVGSYGCSGFMLSEEQTEDTPSNRFSPEESALLVRMASGKSAPILASQDEVSDIMAEFLVESMADNTLGDTHLQLRSQSLCGLRKVFSQVTKLPAQKQVRTLRAIIKFGQFQTAFGN